MLCHGLPAVSSVVKVAAAAAAEALFCLAVEVSIVDGGGVACSGMVAAKRGLACFGLPCCEVSCHAMVCCDRS